MLPAQTTNRLLVEYDFDLQAISENVHIVDKNKIVVARGDPKPSMTSRLTTDKSKILR